MKAKKQETTVKERWKQADKEWSDLFAEVFAEVFYDEILEKKTADVTADVTKKLQAEADRKMQGVVLHLYHTIGLSEKQIAESWDLSVAKVQEIINTDKNKA